MSSILNTKPNRLEDVRDHISRILNFIQHNQVGADCVVKLEVGDEEVVGHLCLKDDEETVIFDTRDDASAAIEHPEKALHNADNTNEDIHEPDAAGDDATSTSGQNIFLDGQNLVSEPEDMDAQNEAPAGEGPHMQETIYQSGNSRFITRSTGFGNVVHNGPNAGFDSEGTFIRRQPRRAVDGMEEVAHQSGNSTFVTRSTPGREDIATDGSESGGTSTPHPGAGHGFAEQQGQEQVTIQLLPSHLEGRSQFLDEYHNWLVGSQAELFHQQRIFNERQFADQERLREEWRRLQNAWGSFQTQTMPPRRNEEGNLNTETEFDRNQTAGATIRREGNATYIATTRSGTVVNVGTIYCDSNGVVPIPDGVYGPGEDGRE